MVTVMNRWHPSRSTPQDRERIRALFPDLYPAMFEWALPTLFVELHRLELANPDDRRLRAYHVILSRRLEAAPEHTP